MMQLVRQMRNQQYEVLNLVFHSSALLEGCGPFVPERTSRRLCGGLGRFFVRQ